MILQVKTRIDAVYAPDSKVPLPDVTPERQHETDAAYDLFAAEKVELAPGDRALVSTGVAVAIPPGYCGLVLPRSGLAIKHGVTVLNAPGLIDPGYRGEIKVALAHLGLRHSQTFNERLSIWQTVPSEPFFHVAVGDRIAQLLIVRFRDAAFVNHVDLGETDRAEGGFGSTGV